MPNHFIEKLQHYLEPLIEPYNNKSRNSQEWGAAIREVNSRMNGSKIISDENRQRNPVVHMMSSPETGTLVSAFTGISDMTTNKKANFHNSMRVLSGAYMPGFNAAGPNAEESAASQRNSLRVFNPTYKMAPGTTDTQGRPMDEGDALRRQVVGHVIGTSLGKMMLEYDQAQWAQGKRYRNVHTRSEWNKPDTSGTTVSNLTYLMQFYGPTEHILNTESAGYESLRGMSQTEIGTRISRKAREIANGAGRGETRSPGVDFGEGNEGKTESVKNMITDFFSSPHFKPERWANHAADAGIATTPDGTRVTAHDRSMENQHTQLDTMLSAVGQVGAVVDEGKIQFPRMRQGEINVVDFSNNARNTYNLDIHNQIQGGTSYFNKYYKSETQDRITPSMFTNVSSPNAVTMNNVAAEVGRRAQTLTPSTPPPAAPSTPPTPEVDILSILRGTGQTPASTTQPPSSPTTTTSRPEPNTAPPVAPARTPQRPVSEPAQVQQTPPPPQSDVISRISQRDYNAYEDQNPGAGGHQHTDGRVLASDAGMRYVEYHRNAENRNRDAGLSNLWSDNPENCLGVAGDQAVNVSSYNVLNDQDRSNLSRVGKAKYGISGFTQDSEGNTILVKPNLFNVPIALAQSGALTPRINPRQGALSPHSAPARITTFDTPDRNSARNMDALAYDNSPGMFDNVSSWNPQDWEPVNISGVPNSELLKKGMMIPLHERKALWVPGFVDPSDTVGLELEYGVRPGSDLYHASDRIGHWVNETKRRYNVDLKQMSIIGGPGDGHDPSVPHGGTEFLHGAFTGPHGMKAMYFGLKTLQELGAEFTRHNSHDRNEPTGIHINVGSVPEGVRKPFVKNAADYMRAFEEVYKRMTMPDIRYNYFNRNIAGYYNNRSSGGIFNGLNPSNPNNYRQVWSHSLAAKRKVNTANGNSEHLYDYLRTHGDVPGTRSEADEKTLKYHSISWSKLADHGIFENRVPMISTDMNYIMNTTFTTMKMFDDIRKLTYAGEEGLGVPAERIVPPNMGWKPEQESQFKNVVKDVLGVKDPTHQEFFWQMHNGCRTLER